MCTPGMIRHQGFTVREKTAHLIYTMSIHQVLERQRCRIVHAFSERYQDTLVMDPKAATRITSRRDGRMDGNIGRMNESILLSFVAVFQTHVCGRRERAYKRESKEVTIPEITFP